MNIPFSVMLHLGLVFASIPAPTLAAPAVAARDAFSAQLKPSVPDERFSPKRKPMPEKNERTVVADASGNATSSDLIPAKGIVLHADQAKATVKIDHDPIPALDWPRMAMSFRLKERGLADHVKKGDAVEFFLEKSGSNYVIVKLRKQVPVKGDSP